MLSRRFRWESFKAYRRVWTATRARGISCNKNGFFISSRGDRYGSNAIPWINAMSLTLATGRVLNHNCSIECFAHRKTVIHDALLRFSKPSRPYPNLHRMEGWFQGQHAELMRLNGGVPLLDFVRSSGLNEKLYGLFLERAEKKNWNQDCHNLLKVTIHVRLDDLRDATDRMAPESRTQGFMGRDRLKELIALVHERFPYHKVQIITAPNPADLHLCRSIADSTRISCEISGSDDVDEDLFRMMNSDILIISRSTFGFIAALLHQGSQVYTETCWDHFDEFIGRIPGFQPSQLIPVLH